MAHVQPAPEVLAGRKALVVGVANEHWIAYGCARAFNALGADLALTYVNDKTKAHVEPLARELNAAEFPTFIHRNNQATMGGNSTCCEK